MRPLRNARDLAKYALAERAVASAKTFIPLLSQHQATEAGAAAYGAICIYYSRPFLPSNRGFGGISNSLVPDDLRQTHDDIMSHRNQIFAHSDIAATALGATINNVFFDVSDKDIRVGSAFICPNALGIDVLSRLLESVHAKLIHVILDCMNSGEPAKRKLSPGRYRLDLHHDKDGHWLMPAD